MTSSLRKKRRITALITQAATERFFQAAIAAAGLLLGGAQLIAQDLGGDSVLPNYPTSKRQIVASNAVEPDTASPTNSLKWGTRRPALPRRSATILQNESQQNFVQPAAMNLRVGVQQTSGVEPAVVLVPAETVIANSPSSVQLTQVRSRFQPQPSLDPPGSPLTAPDRVDIGPSFSTGDDDEPPLTGDPSLDAPTDPSTDPLPSIEPAPAELPELANPIAPDSGAARSDTGEREEMPCREDFRDTNCCEQDSQCKTAWDMLERNPVRLFRRDFLDITPLYRPDVRYSGKEQVDQKKARTEGLAINSLRTWKNTNGHPLGLSEDGTVLGLDGENWLKQWEADANATEQESGGARPPRPLELKGRATNYQRGASEVVVTTETGDAITLPLGKLSLDDNEWLNGRLWRNAEGQVLARGRFYDYEWNRILVREESGRIAVVPLSKLSEMDLCYVGAYWGEGVGLPAECLLRGKLTIRNFTMLTYTWKASGLCHKPLYFEEIELERYGHTFGPVAQPVISGAHFFANIAILPYKMGINPPHECQYALGYYRPGDCAPFMLPPVPLSARGALYEAGAIVGGVALFP